MTAQEILKMIEEVDPADTAKLDEIDARVWCYITKNTFENFHGNLSLEKAKEIFDGVDGHNEYDNLQLAYDIFYGSPDEYLKSCGNFITVNGKWYCRYFDKVTRSRDALKAIRPEGYSFNMNCQDYSRPFASFERVTGEGKKGFDVVNYFSVGASTEELAELHAILQAIDHERNQK